MQNTQQKSNQEEQKEQENFENIQAEAFKHFMKAHFGDPLCKECSNKFL